MFLFEVLYILLGVHSINGKPSFPITIFFSRPPYYHVVVNIENRLEDFPIFFFIIPFILGEVYADPK